MKERNLLGAIGEIDDRFIEEAAPRAQKRNNWIRWVAAACLMLAVGLLAVPMLRGGSRYKYTEFQQSEAGLVLRWEDKTLSERYTSMTFEKMEYHTRGLSVNASLLGDALGTCEAEGYDSYTDQMYSETFAVYEIAGIRNERLVAVCMEEVYYVFLRDGSVPPATLGELLDSYNLAENLPLNRFTDHEGKKETCYTLENDDIIWQILRECADAPVVETEDFFAGQRYISFTATSEALGIYKRVFYITAEGYVKTNILDYGYVYCIGQDAAGRIIDYAVANAVETEPEPYANYVAGTITELGDGYILVNDSVLCWNEKDGVEYKVLTTDPVFSRWLNYYDFQVGDVVYIQYRGEMGEGNVIAGAYTISEAILRNGDVLVAE